jgi:type IV pilus assembly protein PilM
LQVDFSIFNPKARPLIGLDISTSAIKMVELTESGKDAYRVERYAIEQLARDAVVDGNIANLEAVAEAVRRCWTRLGTSTKYVAMSLPTAAVITKKIILPANLREMEMEVQVESEANQYIPFALDEVNLDFQVLGPAPSSPDEVEVLIAASRKEKVEDRVASAEAAELKPIVMDVESFAMQAAFELLRPQLSTEGKDQIVALVDIGAVATKVMVLRGDQPVYSREQAFGGGQLTQEIMRAYGMSFEEAESVKRSGSAPENYEPELLRPFVENLALEVSRALQFFFTSTQFNQVHHIVLAGGCAAIPGVDEVVATRTQVPTVIANPFAGMVPSSRIRPRQLMADAPLLMGACGLALRRFDQ